MKILTNNGDFLNEGSQCRIKNPYYFWDTFWFNKVAYHKALLSSNPLKKPRKPLIIPSEQQNTQPARPFSQSDSWLLWHSSIAQIRDMPKILHNSQCLLRHLNFLFLVQEWKNEMFTFYPIMESGNIQSLNYAERCWTTDIALGTLFLLTALQLQEIFRHSVSFKH